MKTPRQTKAAALLRALLEGREVSLNGQVYKLRKSKDRTGRETFELGLLLLPEKEQYPQFLPTSSSLGEFILLADTMKEEEYELIATPMAEPDLPTSAIYKSKRRIQM
jgi:hypothetical protein